MRARGAILFVAFAACASGRGERSVHAAPPAAANVGPRDVAVPAGATVAEDFDDLARLVADPDGPRDVWLAPRVYRGDLRIRRTVAIHGTRGSVLEGSGTSTVIESEADDVLLEDFTVRNAGRRHTHEDAAIRAKGRRAHVRDVLVDRTLFGVVLNTCDGCTIERTHVVGPDDRMGMRGDGIKLWESHDGRVTDNLVERSRDVVVWYSRHASLERNTITGGRYGTHFMYASDGLVKDSRMLGNVVGVFVMYSARVHIEGNVLAGAHGAAGMGVGFKESESAKVTKNWIVADTAGVYLDRSPRTPTLPVSIEQNVFALDDTALKLHGTISGVAIEDNDFRSNAAAVGVDGGGDALGLRFEGNHWVDYAGYDLDGDGRGDVPFEPKELSSGVKETQPSVRLLEGTIAMRLIDAVAEASPVFAAKKILVDPSPRMRATPIRAPEEPLP